MESSSKHACEYLYSYLYNCKDGVSVKPELRILLFRSVLVIFAAAFAFMVKSTCHSHSCARHRNPVSPGSWSERAIIAAQTRVGWISVAGTGMRWGGGGPQLSQLPQGPSRYPSLLTSFSELAYASFTDDE